MRPFLLYYLLLIGFLGGCKSSKSDQAEPKPTPRVLVFYKTSGFHHESIPYGARAIQELGQEHHFLVDTTADARVFTTEGLRPYRAVIFLSTTQDVLDAPQQTAFEQFIRGGHGFVGIHAATDTEYDWPWYGQLVGAYFNGHPAIQPATINVLTTSHPATAALPARWQRTDEWYNFRDLRPDLTVLATLDESTYTGGTNGATHPIAWYHAFDGGRAFYTAGGHTNESFSEPLFRQHLLGGIQYAIGEE